MLKADGLGASKRGLSREDSWLKWLRRDLSECLRVCGCQGAEWWVAERWEVYKTPPPAPSSPSLVSSSSFSPGSQILKFSCSLTINSLFVRPCSTRNYREWNGRRGSRAVHRDPRHTCKDVRVSVTSRQCQGTSNQGLAMIGRERRDD